jgi:hypothetical protein
MNVYLSKTLWEKKEEIYMDIETISIFLEGKIHRYDL